MRRPVLTTLLLAAGCGTPDPVDIVEPEGPALCGDGVVHSTELCDDGNAFGGDGCTPDCQVEQGNLEIEPNDTWDAANAWSAPEVLGGLPDGDVDCFSFEAGSCVAVWAEITQPCDPSLLLMLHGLDGAVLATGSVGVDGCPVLDPEVGWGAQFLPEGTHAICVSSLTGAPVPSYALALETAPDLFPSDPGDDQDGDGQPNVCDLDRDGDGVPNSEDNCPDVVNGPGGGNLPLGPDGFLTSWLAYAPITGSPVGIGSCGPSAEELTGGDANLAPAIGDLEQGLPWVAYLVGGTRLDFLGNWGFVSPDREVYLHTYVHSDSERDLTLALGPDDGVKAWVNGALVEEIGGCQGTNIDQFQSDVTLLAGWNRLTVKVRDHGGGWGLYARFLDAAGAPVTDLELSLSPDGDWNDDQTDSDGDGIGDVCDETPV